MSEQINAIDTESEDKLPLKTFFGFGLGDFGFVLIWQGTALFLLKFYTDVLGIKPSVAGLIIFVALLWDAISDPIISTMADRSPVTSRGKYRPWLLYGIIPFALSYPLAFTAPPSFWPLGVIVWAFLTHIILRSAYTVVSMPFNALTARVTQNSKERTNIAGFRMIGSSLAGLTVGYGTTRLVDELGKQYEGQSYLIAACATAILTLLFILFCYASISEPVDKVENQKKPDFLSDLASIVSMLMKNSALARVLLVAVLGTISIGFLFSGLTYYFEYQLERPDLTPNALALNSIIFMLGVPICVWLSSKTSKSKTMMVGMSVGAIGYSMFFLNNGGEIALVFIAIALIAFSISAFATMFWAMLPDTVEQGEMMTGVRAEAKTFGFATFAQKAAGGLGAAIFGFYIEFVGFQANMAQSAETLQGFRVIMGLTPAIMCILMIFVMWGYKLNHDSHASLVGQLNKDRSQAGYKSR